MIAKVFGTAVLLALFSVSCSHTSKSGTSTSNPSATAGGTAASGPEAMGRGRCEALTGAERDKCFADERGQRSDATK